VPLPFSITLRKQSDQSAEVCAGEIADEDCQLIASFRQEGAKLRTSEWVKTGLDDHYTLEGDSTGKIVVKVPNRPSDSSVRELLHLLRPFVLQSEATFFPKVTGRLWGYLAHPHLRALLAEHRDGFNHGYGRAYFQLAVSATLDGAMGQNNEDWFVINDARAFDLWVNAFEYHRDDTKRARLREKLGTDPDELSLAIFRSMIADKARAVLHITSFLDELVASPSARRAREQPLG
jgi:hypothetical protein